jgi:hypothetical protein
VFHKEPRAADFLLCQAYACRKIEVEPLQFNRRGDGARETRGVNRSHRHLRLPSRLFQRFIANLPGRGARIDWRFLLPFLRRFAVEDKMRRQKPLYVRMSDKLWDQLDAEAARKGISHSELTRLLIMQYCQGKAPAETGREVVNV